MKTLGIVIPVCISKAQIEPRSSYLFRVLEELGSQRMDGRSILEAHPIVIVDDSSCRVVRDRLSVFQLPERVYVVQQHIPQGIDPEEGGHPWRLASARNRGVDFLLNLHDDELDGFVFLDPDCLPMPGYLAAMEKALEDSPGLVFGRTNPQSRPERVGDSGGCVDRDRRLPMIYETGLFPAAALYERGGGGNMLVRTDIFEASGGFNPEFDGGFGYEETELAVRVHNSLGVMAYYSGDAAVTHLYHPRGEDHFRELDRNRKLFMMKTGLSAFSR